MNFGIITFHRAVNYGAVLQTYALQKALRNLNIDSEVIDYRDNIIDNRFKFFYDKSLKKLVKDFIYFPIFYRKNKKFEEFIEDNIVTTKKIIRNCDELNQLKEFDQYITGSDQVWNYRLTNWDKAYFLDFVKDNKKKNSYAASFGMNEIPKKEQEKYKSLLSQFNHISVREENGIEIIHKLINKDIDVDVDVDPTLLLKKEDWIEIAKEPKEKDYILIFVMQKNESTFKFAEKLAQKTNCEIIYIADSIKRRVNGKYKYTLSPTEWLGYFLNAKYIVTNSFHGLAFSINLNKDFFVELQRPPATGNSRLENMLDLLNLRDRQIIDADNNNIDKEINWKEVNRILDKKRTESFDNLRSVYLRSEKNKYE